MLLKNDVLCLQHTWIYHQSICLHAKSWFARLPIHLLWTNAILIYMSGSCQRKHPFCNPLGRHQELLPHHEVFFAKVSLSLCAVFDLHASNALASYTFGSQPTCFDPQLHWSHWFGPLMSFPNAVNMRESTSCVSFIMPTLDEKLSKKTKIIETLRNKRSSPKKRLTKFILGSRGGPDSLSLQSPLWGPQQNHRLEIFQQLRGDSLMFTCQAGQAYAEFIDTERI